MTKPAEYFVVPMVLVMALATAVLGGCVATTPAPVSDRALPGKTPPRTVISKPPDSVSAAPAAPGAVAKPDAGVIVKPLAPDAPTSMYTVKQGDTLFSIAKSNGVALRDLAAWNGIEDRTSITLGQQLRLTPPDGVAIAPVKPPGAVEAKPLGAADGTPPAGDANLKTQPLATRVPYSDQAYAQMTQVSKAPLATNPESKPDVKADAKADTKTENKPDAKAAAPRADGEINWSWPAEGKVIGNFNEGSNKGIVIAGKRGQAVNASAAGRVIFSGTGIRGLGKLVVIRHNSTYLSVYAHNDKLLVKEGQNVTKGQRIAEMGNSDADQVKLHFEIRRQGKPVDPIKLLPAT